jgi:hypothetical protein
VRAFLWKCTHNAYKIGNFWDKIPEHEHYSLCPVCKVEKSMEHILLQCTIPGQQVIWNLARQLWELKKKRWPRISYGTILGCSLAKMTDNVYKRGDNRLFHILVSESAHLIWKLRCERRITHNDSPVGQLAPAEIHNRWLQIINSRLTMDRILTDKWRYGKKALRTKTVLDTWDEVLWDRTHLPNNWIQHTGVLVGIGPRRPPGRNR